MTIPVQVLHKINGVFKKPVHPFNLQEQGVETYAQWQFRKGMDTVEYYLDFCSIQEMFQGKTVVDIGCGAGGKSLFYASSGAKKVYGIEILEGYRDEANGLAEQLGLSGRFEFCCADAAQMPFKENSVDTIIMNDAMEHVQEPERVLEECLRVLKKGRYLFLNFPPYYHPFGAHLSDAISIPWVHLFFSEKTLVQSYKALVHDLPDGQRRVQFRISEKEGKEYFSYINHMTVKRFQRILKGMGIQPQYYRQVPLRPFTAPLCHLPGLREMFVKMVVCVIRKG